MINEPRFEGLHFHHRFLGIESGVIGMDLEHVVGVAGMLGEMVLIAAPKEIIKRKQSNPISHSQRLSRNKAIELLPIF
jgi:hypothetical protein